MLAKMRNIYKSLYLRRLIRHGLTVGKCFQMEKGCNLDANFPWLISIGDNVTFASRVVLLTHDGSTKKLTGYSKVGKATIGNDVFIGYRSIVMPNITIGNGAVVGAHSVVTRSVAPGTVVVGSPAKQIMTTEELAEKALVETNGRGPYGREYLRNSINPERADQTTRWWMARTMYARTT